MARREPGTAEPYISQPINLNEFRGFLVLMSDGLYEAYETWTGRPFHVNEDIAHLVAEEMKKSSDLSIVAQNVVEKVKHLFRSACKEGKRSGRLDDITLIVRNFGYPMAVPHTRSYPDGMSSLSSAHSGGSGHHPPSLLPSMSYPSQIQNQAISSVGYPGPGGYPALYSTPGQQYYVDPRAYGGGMGQPFQSLAVGSSGASNVPNTGVLYSTPLHAAAGRVASQGHYTAQQTNFDAVSSSSPRQGFINHGYNVGGGGGGYPPNYTQSNQMVGGAGGFGQQRQRTHPPAGYTASDPSQQVPPHPEYNKRSNSIPVNMPSPEHRGQQHHVSGLRHEYENVSNRPLNTIVESPSSNLTASPTNASVSVSPGGAVYENVAVRTQHTLQQPAGEGQGLQTNRYSDSCLNEKMRDASLEDTNLGPSVPTIELPVRPRSAEPTRPANDDLSSLSALPSNQPSTLNQREEDMLLYGWSADEPGSQLNSMSTLKSQPGTLSSSEVPSIRSESSLLAASTGDSEARTPINVEDRQLGSAAAGAVSRESGGAASEEDEEEDGDGDEGVFTADMSDFSEASGTEGDEDQINPESGEIRPYIKNWGNFPFDKPWDEV